MTYTRTVALGLAMACLLGARPALAQVDEAGSTLAPPAHISVVDGTVLIEHEGRADAAVVNVPLLVGDRIRTEAGRAEVLFPDGSALQVDQSTSVDLLAPDLLRLLEGRISLVVAGAGDPSRATRFQIDAPAASVQTDGPGEYRLALLGSDVELAVLYGSATLASDLGAVGVGAGERSVARAGAAPSPAQYFNSARLDAFDQWSAGLHTADVASVSTRYLPADLQTYSSTFDRYGSWGYDAAYGNVWYPSASDGWWPYSQGYWDTYPDYGSVWIGSDPWGWPTHHYGRWGVSGSGAWFWIPGRVWAPAWVYWAVGPGYVGWCPLGWNDSPVYGMWGVRGAFSIGRHRDPWRAWTVVPTRDFGRRAPMHRFAVNGDRLDPRARGAFVAQRMAPRTGYAVPRGTLAGSNDRRASGQRPGAVGLGGAARDRGARSSPGTRAYSDRTAIPRYGRGDGTGVNSPMPYRSGSGRGFAAPGTRRTIPGAPSGGAVTQPAPLNRGRFGGPTGVPSTGGGASRREPPSGGAVTQPAPLNRGRFGGPTGMPSTGGGASRRDLPSGGAVTQPAPLNRGRFGGPTGMPSTGGGASRRDLPSGGAVTQPAPLNRGRFGGPTGMPSTGGGASRREPPSGSRTFGAPRATQPWSQPRGGAGTGTPRTLQPWQAPSRPPAQAQPRSFSRGPSPYSPGARAASPAPYQPNASRSRGGSDAGRSAPSWSAPRSGSRSSQSAPPQRWSAPSQGGNRSARPAQPRYNSGGGSSRGSAADSRARPRGPGGSKPRR